MDITKINNILTKEHLAPTIGWQAKLDEEQPQSFCWVSANYRLQNYASPDTPVKVCVVGYGNDEKTITPIIFTHSGQWIAIIGHKLASDGIDINGVYHRSIDKVIYTVYSS